MSSTEVSHQSCGCKGVRFCALCETSERVLKLRTEDDKYVSICPTLTSTASIEDIITASLSSNSPQHACDVIFIDGIMIVPDFLSESEENILLEMIDGVDWMLSQSGRRKQDYGPKVNFKHKKVKFDSFVGMPEYADFLLEKMQSISAEKLGNYIPFEMCNLEYDQSKKSAIEMHFDDMWIWGNRLIRNLIDNCFSLSLLMYYRMEHAVLSRHIRGRRIALTMREPSKEFQEGGEFYEKYGKQLITLSNIRVPLRKCIS
uniref:2OG-FeII_Oxy_2 domain-containing protein n=1 Tax=Angiostrongylus cantonensis TaxID=6313 RepID=A0A0K0DAQ1_ANGCA